MKIVKCIYCLCVFIATSSFAESVGIVDFGAKLGSGFYSGELVSSYSPRVDRENDGTLTNDFVSSWAYDPTDPLNPNGLDYDTNVLNGVFYGGLTLYASSDYYPRGISEGHINQNHEFNDDFNFMTAPAPRPNELFEAYAFYYWPKEGFLNGGADYTVTFDTNSAIAIEVTRYWGGINAGRWVVRDGDQFYLSEDTFAGVTNQWDIYSTNVNLVLRKTHIINPLATRWAEYTPAPDPAYPYEIDFDPSTATYINPTFTNVTAIGFFIERYLSPPRKTTEGADMALEPMGVKWDAVRAEAVINSPASPSRNIGMGSIPSGANMASHAVPYDLWSHIYRFAVRRQFVDDMGLGTYSLEKEGAMGKMRADNAPHNGLEPVTDITWYDAVAWCNALSEFEGLEPCYYTDATHTNTLRVIVYRDIIDQWTNRPTVYWNTNATGFRLPTPEEWSQQTASMQNTSFWEYVWFPSGVVADPSVQTTRTVQAWGLTAPTQSILQFGEHPWEGSPRITFRPLRNSGATPLFGSATGTTQWSFQKNTVLPPASPLSKYDTRAVVTQLLSEVTLNAGLADTNHVADRGFNPFETLETSNPYSVEFGATEIPYRLWNFVQQWAMDNGYEFNYTGDMGSMGSAPDATYFSPDEPVTEISYYDMLVWCNALSEIMERRPVFYKDATLTTVWRQANQFRLETLLHKSYPHWPDQTFFYPIDTASYIPVYQDVDANGYRLPLPQEWDLVNETDINSGTDAYNWTLLNSSGKTHAVATKLPNPLGLYDMEGNARERTWGDTRAFINWVMQLKGSHYAREYQGSWPGIDKEEVPSVGRTHIGFRTLRLTAADPIYDGIEVSTLSLSVPEGSSSTLDVHLSEAPLSTTTVQVSRVSGDTDITVNSGATLIFTTTDWNTNQTVTLAASEDSDGINGTAVIRCQADGISPKEVAITEQDNDAAVIVSSSPCAVHEGSTTNVYLSLTLSPSTPVTVTVQRVSGDTDITVSGSSSFVFDDQNWNQTQSLTIAAGEDDDIIEGSATLRCSSPGIASSEDIIVTEIENDFTIVASGLLAAWELDSISSAPIVTEADAYFMSTGLVQSVLTHRDTSKLRGGKNALKAIDNDEATIADAITADNYFYWQIQPQSNYMVTVTSIVVRTDADNPTTETFVLSDASGIDAASTLIENGTGLRVGRADLSGRAEFENQNNPIEFRIYGYKDSSQYTAMYIGRKYYADNLDDVLVYGSVAYIEGGGGGQPPVSNQFNLSVSPASLSILEGSSDSISVSLSEAPASTVTVSVQRTSGDTNISVLSGSELIFTTENWSNSQTVVIQAAEDNDHSNSTAVVTISSENSAPVDVTVTWQSAGAIPQLVASTDALTIGEGSSAEITLNLSAEPIHSTTVNVAVVQSQDASFTLTTSGSMVFDASNWSAPQTAVVQAAEDAYAVDGTGTLRFSSDNFTDLDVSLAEQDDDPSGASAISGTILVDCGVSYKQTTGWNNLTGAGLGIVSTNLITTNGSLSGMTLEITDAFEGNFALAAAVLPEYPSSAQEDLIRVMSPETYGKMVFSGFAANSSCTVKILSTQNVQSWGSEGEVAVNGVAVTTDTQYNTELTVWSNVSPTAQGNIEIELNRLSTGLAVINLIQIDYASPVESVDQDADGMPNWWEDLYGYGQTGADPSAVASNGVNTLLETYIAGLDPADANSTLTVLSIDPLRWSAAQGRSYSIYWTSNLLNGFQLLKTNLTSGSFTDVLYGAESEGFYRINVELAP